MRPIPEQLKEEIQNDKYYKKCCLCPVRQVQWHHNLIFAGRQVNEKECILPICEVCHNKARNTEIREQLDLIMLTRMSPEQMQKYSKAVDLFQRYNYLCQKYPL
jgi:hypothetical protein